MKKRSIPIMILLSIVTVGFYQIYWYISFQNQLKKTTGEGFGGLGHLLITIVTVGIYSFYWNYACGKRLAKLGAIDNSIVYLIVGFIPAISFINMFLKQSQANSLN